MQPAATEQLVRGAAAGDAECWNALVDRFTPLLWSVARGFRLQSADAADAVATGWLRLLENLPRITDSEQLGAWLVTTVRRECLSQIARTNRESPSTLADLDTVDPSAEVSAGLLAAERDTHLWAAIEELPDRCRLMIRVLIADPPPSYAEISAALDMPVGSIGPSRGRCFAHLRRLLAGHGIKAAGSRSRYQEREEVADDKR